MTSVKDNTGIINNSKETSEEGLVDYMFECEDEIQLLVSKEGYESKMIDIKLLDIDPPLLKIKLDPIEELIVEEKIVLNLFTLNLTRLISPIKQLLNLIN